MSRMFSAGSTERQFTLEDCLKQFSAEEQMDDENLVTCDVCKTKRKVSKQLTIYRYPRVLIIQMKRFRYNSASRSKLNTHINFPLKDLDLTEYLSEYSPYKLGKEIQVPIEAGNPANDIDIPDPPIQFFSTDKQTYAKPIYDLIGVTNHSGSLFGGHYIAHCNTTNTVSASTTGEVASSGDNRGTATWKCFNDSHVSEADPNEIGGASAYVLFYRLRGDAFYDVTP